MSEKTNVRKLTAGDRDPIEALTDAVENLIHRVDAIASAFDDVHVTVEKALLAKKAEGSAEDRARTNEFLLEEAELKNENLRKAIALILGVDGMRIP